MPVKYSVVQNVSFNPPKGVLHKRYRFYSFLLFNRASCRCSHKTAINMKLLHSAVKMGRRGPCVLTPQRLWGGELEVRQEAGDPHLWDLGAGFTGIHSKNLSPPL